MLVIDDDPTARDLLAQDAARRKAIASSHARSGEEALALAREHRPQAITLDVMMPRMDGWAVLTALKADPELRDIPVIMVTISTSAAWRFRSVPPTS